MKGRRHPKKGDTVSLDIFSSWSEANITTATFNFILVAVFLFPLNVGVSPNFHCPGGEGACMFLKKWGMKKEGCRANTPFRTMFCNSDILFLDPR